MQAIAVPDYLLVKHQLYRDTISWVDAANVEPRREHSFEAEVGLWNIFKLCLRRVLTAIDPTLCSFRR